MSIAVARSFGAAARHRIVHATGRPAAGIAGAAGIAAGAAGTTRTAGAHASLLAHARWRVAAGATRGLFGCGLGGHGGQFGLQGDDFRRFLGALRGQTALLGFKLLADRTVFDLQCLKIALLGGSILRGLLRGRGLGIGLLLELGDLLLDGVETLLTVHRRVQRRGRGIRGIGCRTRRRGIGTMETVTCDFGDGLLGVIVFDAGVLDFLLKRRLVLLGGFKTLVRRIGQALRLV